MLSQLLLALKRMQKRLLLILTLLHGLSVKTQYQPEKLDSLLNKLRISNLYTEKVELLGQISDYYSYSDSGNAISYANRIKELAEQENDTRGLGIAYFRLGNAYIETNSMEIAETNYEHAEQLLQKDTSRVAREYLARTFANHGMLYQLRGDHDTYLKYLLEKAIPINKLLNDSATLGRNFHNIGLTFQNIGDFTRAIHYYQHSLHYLAHAQWIPEAKDNYIRLVDARIYSDVPASFRDSAIQLLNKAASLIKEYPDPVAEVLYLQEMGAVHEYFDNDLDLADSFYIKAVQLANHHKLEKYIPLLLTRRFYIKNEQKKYPEALKVAKELYYEHSATQTPANQLLALKHLMEAEEKAGNYKKALELNKMYIQLNDSIQTRQVSLKVRELEKRYEAKETENRLFQLNRTSQAQQLQIQKNRLWILLLGLSVLFLISFFVVRQILLRNNSKIEVQKSEILQQRLEKMKQEQHLNHFTAILKGQEQERKRLALELHDGLGGSLSGIRLKLSKVIQDHELHPDNIQIEPITNIAKDLDVSINDLRQIARNMMPESLLKYGLETAIKDFCRSMETEDLKIQFQSYDVRRDLPEATQLMIFRIMQELISNAVKHADATNILAQCLQQKDKIWITVEDDGKGFDTHSYFEGMGLTTLKSRVGFLNGKMEIQSEATVGTTVNIEFPIHYERQN